MYFLFAGETYYPRGGMDDLVGVFPTVEAAVQRGENPEPEEDGYRPTYDWYHIATMVDGKLVVVE
jgi:hypothetical protein